MRRMLQIGIPLAIAAAVLTYQNCAGTNSDLKVGGDGSLQKTETAQTIQERYKALQNLAASQVSCETKADCTVMGIGAKPCGGPSSFVVTSSANDLQTLSRLNGELQAAERAYFEQNQIMGDCMVLATPEAQCESQTCTLAPGHTE